MKTFVVIAIPGARVRVDALVDGRRAYIAATFDCLDRACCYARDMNARQG